MSIPISSWGRLSADPHEVSILSDRKTALAVIGAGHRGLPHGNGRSYGDVCLNPGGLLWKTTGLDRFIHFDTTTGLLRCEAGILLRDIQQMSVPRGWILPVTPGTQLITVGGAIANDVHGKNHHVLGTFGNHVRLLTLARTNGQLIECGPNDKPDWYAATVGGLGLTGVILEATIQLRRVAGPWLETENIPYTSLDEFFHLADESEANWEHTVSWIDCLSGAGKGIFMRGNPADVGPRPAPTMRKRTMPLTPPMSLVNGLSLRPFNLAYYQLQKLKGGRGIAHYEPFFYPLDNLLEWNRMYGPRGFYQYQSVVPREGGKEAVAAMLKEIEHSGEGSFLAVLKTFGKREPVGMLSFPRPGVTLALDFPNKGEKTLKLLARLDAIVKEVGGCLYPAKDARMPPELFRAGYPHLDEFLKFRDPGISSGLSRRLIGN